LQVQKTKPGCKLVQWYYGKKLEIPEEWRLSKLGKECKQIQDADHQTPEKTKEGVPFLTINNVVENERIDFSNTEFVSQKDYLDFIKKVKPGKGDLLYSRVATIGIARMIEEDRKFVVTSNVVVIKPKQNIDSRYLLFQLNSNLIKNRVLSLTPGSAYAFLSLKEINKIPILLPSYEEQQKIASILSNADSLILQYDRIIQQTKRLKKGLMQQLLTKGIGHTKFKKVKWFFGKEIEIPNNWISKKVEDVFKLKSGSTPSRTKLEFFEGDISWVTSTDLNRSKIISTIEKITKDAVKNTNLAILPKGTFLIATYGLEAAGTRGKCGILEMVATCNQACMAFLPSSEMTSVFLFYFYLYFGEKIVFSIAQGTKQQNLGKLKM